MERITLKDKKIIKDSQNLNGPGNADFVFDEKDLEAAGKKTWLQFLEENVKGFHESDRQSPWNFIQDYTPTIEPLPGQIVSTSHLWYFIDDKPTKIYVDGISLNAVNRVPDFFILDYKTPYTYLTGYLKGTSAEDIKGIEVSYSDKYSGGEPIDRQKWGLTSR